MPKAPPKTPREIVLAAFHYLADITPPTQKVSDVRVEELQPLEEAGTKFWKVVLSYDNTGDFPFDKKREYKEFKVSSEGKVLLIKPVDAK